MFYLGGAPCRNLDHRDFGRLAASCAWQNTECSKAKERIKFELSLLMLPIFMRDLKRQYKEKA